MVDYDSHSGDFDGDDDLKLTTMPYAAIDGNFDGIREGNSDWGQSIGERYEETALVDGALYRRDDDQSKIKLYSWDSLGFDAENEEFNAVEFKRKTENYGGETYEYTLIAASVDELGEVWIGTDNGGEPFLDTNEEGQPVVGNVIIWNGGSSDNGPNSTAKTAARTLTDLGRGAVLDEDDVFNWYKSSATVRNELEGRRLRRFKVEREGEKYSFYTPVFVDVATGERIGIANDDDGNGDADESSSESESEKTAMQQAAEKATTDGGADFPDAVDDCIDYCVEQDMTDEEDVMGTFQVMAENPESSISMEMIETAGQDNILETIQERAA
jgi:hypothetical protein